jgi:hypothetical protein
MYSTVLSGGGGGQEGPDRAGRWEGRKPCMQGFQIKNEYLIAGYRVPYCVERLEFRGGIDNLYRKILARSGDNSVPTIEK